MEKKKVYPIINKTRVAAISLGLIYFAVVIYLRLTAMISETIYSNALFGGLGVALLMTFLVWLRQRRGDSKSSKRNNGKNTQTM